MYDVLEAPVQYVGDREFRRNMLFEGVKIRRFYGTEKFFILLTRSSYWSLS
jgi:hypothetical protein